MAGHLLKGRRIALGVGGGIAAYKACELTRELLRAGAEVRVAMTDAAQQFVTPLTFQSLSGKPVLTNYFSPEQEATFGHLDLARWADLFVVAPATADLIARIKGGLANDAVTTPLLAFRKTVLLAPAMNVAMFENPITQENLRVLSADARFRTVGPGAGLLACGDIGQGRLAEVPEIVAAIEALAAQGPLRGKRVLVTAGPTREHFDPVRYLSNPSTGKMGLCMALAARARGAEVTVVLGPVTGPLERDGLDVVDIVSAEDMLKAVLPRVPEADFFVAAAAVSDYRPAQFSAQKVKKSEGGSELPLVRTPDVLAEAARLVAANARRPVLIGFAAETEEILEHAREKLDRKGLDFILANDVSGPGAGFAADTNRVLLVSRQGAPLELAGPKRDVAEQAWDVILRTAGVSSAHV
jgi:phosphopantothenoylcysteine decarboxylase/phosphopantothenate--cysteine ligase